MIRCAAVFVVFTVLYAVFQAMEFEDWGNPMFLFQYSLSCLLGFVLNYSIVVCTHYNSALTTTIVGVLKVRKTTFSTFVLFNSY